MKNDMPFDEPRPTPRKPLLAPSPAAASTNPIERRLEVIGHVVNLRLGGAALHSPVAFLLNAEPSRLLPLLDEDDFDFVMWARRFTSRR
jgi:hypothetical protein